MEQTTEYKRQVGRPRRADRPKVMSLSLPTSLWERVESQCGRRESGQEWIRRLLQERFAAAEVK